MQLIEITRVAVNILKTMTWYIRYTNSYILQTNKERCAEKIMKYDRFCPEASHDCKLNMICGNMYFLKSFITSAKI